MTIALQHRSVPNSLRLTPVVARDDRNRPINLGAASSRMPTGTRRASDQPAYSTDADDYTPTLVNHNHQPTPEEGSAQPVVTVGHTEASH